jgi:hypothetical protein
MKELTEKSNKPKTGKASQKPRAKPGRKRSTTKGSKARAGSGGARLRNSIDKKVGEQSDLIAQALIDKTKAGNATVARIVVGISGADKAPAETKKKKRGPQPWIMRLASEPELPGPWDEQRKRDASLLPLSDYDLPEDLK